MDGTVDNQPLMAFAERQAIDEVVERYSVVGISGGVQPKCPEKGIRQPRCRLELLNQSLRWRIALGHCDVPEKRHRVMVKDPVVLGADERGHGRRWNGGQRLSRCDSNRGEIAQGPFIVVSLLLDVAFEVRYQGSTDRIFASTARLFAGCF